MAAGATGHDDERADGDAGGARCPQPATGAAVRRHHGLRRRRARMARRPLEESRRPGSVPLTASLPVRAVASTPSDGYFAFPQTDGPDAMRRFVRKNVEGGAHHIKMVLNNRMITGPSLNRQFKGTSMTKEEMVAAVSEAHRLGVRVTVHAQDVESEKLALEAGADSLQHAANLTPEILICSSSRRRPSSAPRAPGSSSSRPRTSSTWTTKPTARPTGSAARRNW